MFEIIGACLVFTTIFAAVAFAQGSKQQASGFFALVAASEIKGTKVTNLQNQTIGAIEEVLIEPGSGHVRFVVLEVGGFLGLGSTRVAVPWTAFQLSSSDHKPKWVLDADKEKLKNAPKVEGTHYERLYTASEAEPIFIYWKITWIAPEPNSTLSPSSTP